MVQYAVLFADIPTQTILGELPLEDFTFQNELNTGGSFSGTMSLENGSTVSIYDMVADSTSELVIPPVGLDEIIPARTAVFVLRNDIVLWHGVMTGDTVDVAAETVTVNAAGWEWILERRYLLENLSFTATEQTAIAYSLINSTQTNPGGGLGDLGIADNTAATGIARDRNYYTKDQVSVAEALRSLAAVQRGFDYKFDASVSAGSYALSFRTTYPASGRDTNHVFELGANVEVLNVQRDVSALANAAWVIGEESATLQAVEYGGAGIGEGAYPLLMVAEAPQGISEYSTLLDRANRHLRRGKAPITRVTLQAGFGTTPELGSFEVGDNVAIKGSIGALVLDDTYRIISISVNVPREGAESVVIQAAPAALFE